MKSFKPLLIASLLLINLFGCATKEAPETKNEIKFDHTPLILIDEKLYSTKGLINNTDEQTYDGLIATSVDISEIPSEHLQSNFGAGYPYRIVDEDKIEVLIDDDWVIFEANNHEVLSAKDLFDLSSSNSQIEIIYDAEAETYSYQFKASMSDEEGETIIQMINDWYDSLLIIETNDLSAEDLDGSDHYIFKLNNEDIFEYLRKGSEAYLKLQDTYYQVINFKKPNE